MRPAHRSHDRNGQSWSGDRGPRALDDPAASENAIAQDHPPGLVRITKRLADRLSARGSSFCGTQESRLTAFETTEAIALGEDSGRISHALVVFGRQCRLGGSEKNPSDEGAAHVRLRLTLHIDLYAADVL